MRGKEFVQSILLLKGGITPACAGKRFPMTARLAAKKDHPRMCGEKKRSGDKATANAGSPPHVRGKELQKCRKNLTEGITPACAGKSDSSPSWEDATRDHPRMCGEKGFPLRGAQWCRGSPPHVRGKEIRFTRRNYENRITPACAGKRLLPCLLQMRPWDHPRMCGEKRLKRSK